MMSVGLGGCLKRQSTPSRLNVFLPFVVAYILSSSKQKVMKASTGGLSSFHNLVSAAILKSIYSTFWKSSCEIAKPLCLSSSIRTLQSYESTMCAMSALLTSYLSSICLIAVTTSSTSVLSHFLNYTPTGSSWALLTFSFSFQNMSTIILFSLFSLSFNFFSRSFYYSWFPSFSGLALSNSNLALSASSCSVIWVIRRFSLSMNCFFSSSL